MNNLFDILELCLEELENGAEVESLLARYPDQAEELRPLLTAAIHARQMAVPAPSAEVVRRNRAKLLQHAAQLREAGTKKKVFAWFPAWQRAAAFALLAVFLFSGTSLVRASSNSLPGDSLYSVKRSWESVLLFLTFDDMKREALEIEHANKRLEELRELFAGSRSVEVDFAGVVSREAPDGWWISNILVVVSDQTVLPKQPIQVGAAVRVFGVTQGNGMVIAQRFEVLPPGAPVPDVEEHDEPDVEESELTATPKPGNSGPGSGSATRTPEGSGTQPVPSPTPKPKIEKFTGVIMSMNSGIWRIDGAPVDVRSAEIIGVPVIGALAEVEGYLGADGTFVARKIRIITSGSNDNVNVNSNDNDNSSNANTNDNTNNNSNDNTNDNVNDNDDNSNNDNGGSGNDNNDNGVGDD